MAASRDVNVLRQQMDHLRSNSNPSSPTGATGSLPRRRESGSTFKVALLGPTMAGKTKIASHISGAPFPTKYEPTAGVRILEVDESDLVTRDGREVGRTLALELWDCGGDQKFEPCWPAICDKLDGAIVCFDPTNKSQANDVRLWFCKRAGLVDGQVIIFAHGELSGSHKPLSVRAGDRTVLAPIVNVSTVNLPPPDEEGRPQMTPAKAEWRNFVAGVWAVFREAEARENGEIDL